MNAVRLHVYGGPDQLKFESGVPDPVLHADTVLISTAAASVNPVDWKIRSGALQKIFPQTLPVILGRDVSGTVAAVGANVRHVKPGDRVLALTNGTYAELVAVDAALVTHLPDGVDLVDAAALPLVCLTGNQLVRRATTAARGDTLLVTGAVGSVGRAAVHTARKLGLRVIAGVRASQMAAARALQVDGVLAIDDPAELERHAPVDAVADTVGGELARRLLGKVTAGGSFGYAAALPEDAAAAFPQVKVSRVFAQPEPATVREFCDDVRDGKFVLPIGRRLALREAALAHELGERGGVGKILLRA